MENENVMENNEVMEVAEEITKTNSGLGLKIIGGVLALGGAIYGGIKLRKKIKAKKEEACVMYDDTDDENIDYEDVDEEKTKSKK